MRRQRRRVNGRFFLFLGGLALALVVTTLLLLGGGGAGEIGFGSINAELKESGVIIREETIVSTE